MSMLIGTALQKEVNHYYKKTKEKEKQYGVERKAGIMTQAHRYECIADTLKASASIPGLRNELAFYKAFIGTEANRVRLVRQCLEKDGDKALVMALELMRFWEEIADEKGLLETVSLGEAKVEED